MIDLSQAYAEATNNVLTWRNRYSAKEYPHKVVINMMYRAYGMQFIWNEFKRGTLPRFSSVNDALIGMERHYQEISITEIRDNLLNWLKTKPNDSVGTLTYSNYEKNVATPAEIDKKKREELEFSYIFEMLEDKCVLYYIGFRQMGKSFQDAVAMITNVLIEDIPTMDYNMAKHVFQQLLVARYMHEHYNEIP